MPPENIALTDEEIVRIRKWMRGYVNSFSRCFDVGAHHIAYMCALDLGYIGKDGDEPAQFFHIAREFEYKPER
jgi:hypothetical protein